VWDRDPTREGDPFQCTFADAPEVLAGKIEDFFERALNAPRYFASVQREDGSWHAIEIEKAQVVEINPTVGPWAGTFAPMPHPMEKCALDAPNAAVDAAKLKKLAHLVGDKLQGVFTPKATPFTAETFAQVVKDAVAKKIGEITASKTTGSYNVVLEPHVWGRYDEPDGFPAMGFRILSDRTPDPHYAMFDPYAVCAIALHAGLDFRPDAPEKLVQVESAVRRYACRMFNEVHLSYPPPKGS
jgi:hypothetical protein